MTSAVEIKAGNRSSAVAFIASAMLMGHYCYIWWRKLL